LLEYGDKTGDIVIQGDFSSDLAVDSVVSQRPIWEEK